MSGEHIITTGANAMNGQTLEEKDLKPTSKNITRSAVLLKEKIGVSATKVIPCNYQWRAFEMMAGNLKD